MRRKWSSSRPWSAARYGELAEQARGDRTVGKLRQLEHVPIALVQGVPEGAATIFGRVAEQRVQARRVVIPRRADSADLDAVHAYPVAHQRRDADELALRITRRRAGLAGEQDRELLLA